MFLTDEQIETMSGCRKGKHRASSLRRWLTAHGYTEDVDFFQRTDGWFDVKHPHVESRMTGLRKLQRQERARMVALARTGAEARSPDWAPPAVEVLPLASLYELPEVDDSARCSGVYFLFHDRQLVYVGCAVNVRERVREHVAAFSGMFTQARFLSIPAPWHMAIEALYIRAYRPKANRHHVGDGVQ
jgi:hypothetical protein